MNKKVDTGNCGFLLLMLLVIHPNVTITLKNQKNKTKQNKTKQKKQDDKSVAWFIDAVILHFSHKEICDGVKKLQ